MIRHGQGPLDVLGKKKICGYGQVVRTAPQGSPAPAASLDIEQSNLTRPGNLSQPWKGQSMSVRAGVGYSHLNSPGHEAHGAGGTVTAT